MSVAIPLFDALNLKVAALSSTFLFCALDSPHKYVKQYTLLTSFSWFIL